jgi:hypothetical protein
MSWKVSDVRRRAKQKRAQGLSLSRATVVDVEKKSRGKRAMATIVSAKCSPGNLDSYDPRTAIALSISQALDPQNAPKPVRSFASMSEEEKEEMHRLYSKENRRK